ncbi:hypothetical protein F8388_021779 [Cannabis sativa]|uniref:Uncharacterized protein n=1 Tax=Cannabis sativa TaxID=3483 RepID=A0A7J6DSY3_CANSA|nr:hypothetical protein F8388_021779 [Cannabis sativa]
MSKFIINTKKLVATFGGKLSHIILQKSNEVEDETKVEPEAEANQQLRRPRPIERAWPETIMGFCFASALQIATLQSQLQSKLSPNLVLVSLAILFSFTSIFISKYIASKFPKTALVLEQLGVWFTITAFFVAITVSLTKPLVALTWFVYIISLTIIIVESELSLALNLVYATIISAFACFVVSKFIASKFPRSAHVLERIDFIQKQKLLFDRRTSTTRPSKEKRPY